MNAADGPAPDPADDDTIVEYVDVPDSDLDLEPSDWSDIPSRRGCSGRILMVPAGHCRGLPVRR